MRALHSPATTPGRDARQAHLPLPIFAAASERKHRPAPPGSVPPAGSGPRAARESSVVRTAQAARRGGNGAEGERGSSGRSRLVAIFCLDAGEESRGRSWRVDEVRRSRRLSRRVDDDGDDDELSVDDDVLLVAVVVERPAATLEPRTSSCSAALHLPFVCHFSHS